MEQIWWKEAVGYQIYPRSFYDSNGDGIGDLKGITEKLDYIKSIGIDVIWICPMYKSPNDDNGYDISDYKDIMSDFGNMEDFDELMNEVHKRKMKLIIDLVINHTSDEHPWFIESRSSKDSPKRDWYIWRDGKNGVEPNNWESIFKGSAWEYDEKTKEYFLHLFTKRQPDLNWENEEVRRELYDTVNWWLDKGVDGFRVDAISHIKKEEGLKDMPNPLNERYVSSFDKHMNIDGIHKFLDELNKETFSKYDIMTVGEANGVNAKEADLWVGKDKGKFNMLFQFEHLKLWDYENDLKFSVKAYKDVLTKWQNALSDDGWNALFIENHDIPRAISTWGNDNEYREECAKAFAMCYMMQKGTAFIYQGQEIGMTNVKFSNIEDYDDVKGINIYKEKIDEGASHDNAIAYVHAISRDNARTPMQWNSSTNAGFTQGKPWMKINPNYKEINVDIEEEREDSVLNFYKRLISIKKNSKTLLYGKYELILEEDESIYAYTREFKGEKYFIICNLSDLNRSFNFNIEFTNEELVLANYKNMNFKTNEEIELQPWECRMYKKNN
ncbi:MAG: glycoside hydrolase family 13 protein [Sarcina sp.]